MIMTWIINHTFLRDAIIHPWPNIEFNWTTVEILYARVITSILLFYFDVIIEPCPSHDADSANMC